MSLVNITQPFTPFPEKQTKKLKKYLIEVVAAVVDLIKKGEEEEGGATMKQIVNMPAKDHINFNKPCNINLKVLPNYANCLGHLLILKFPPACKNKYH